MLEAFLVRTKQNQIWGPFTKERLAEKVLKGEFEQQDEICLSGEYWVFLHEKEEIKKFLGVYPPDGKRTRSSEDEVTETETETVIPEHTQTPIQSYSGEAPPKTDPAVPYYEDSGYHLEQPVLFKVLLWLLVICVGLILYRIFLRTSGA
jgi:hypothetical protein